MTYCRYTTNFSGHVLFGLFQNRNGWNKPNNNNCLFLGYSDSRVMRCPRRGCKTFSDTVNWFWPVSVINSGPKRKKYSDHSSYSYCRIGPNKCTLSCSPLLCQYVLVSLVAIWESLLTTHRFQCFSTNVIIKRAYTAVCKNVSLQYIPCLLKLLDLWLFPWLESIAHIVPYLHLHVFVCQYQNYQNALRQAFVLSWLWRSGFLFWVDCEEWPVGSLPSCIMSV